MLTRDVRFVHNDTRVQGNQSIRRREQWIDVDFFDEALLDDELRKTHHQLFERRQIDRLAPADTFQRFVNRRPFDHPARERGVQRRQRERAIFEHFDQLPAGAEQQHGTKLRIDARTDDKFVPVGQFNHRLDGHALKMLRTHFIAHRFVDRAPRAAHIVRVGKVQLHAAHIGFVRDGFGKKFQHNRITDFICVLHRIVFNRSDARFGNRNVVRGEELFRLKLGENRATGRAHRVDYFFALRAR